MNKYVLLLLIGPRFKIKLQLLLSYWNNTSMYFVYLKLYRHFIAIISTRKYLSQVRMNCSD